MSEFPSNDRDMIVVLSRGKHLLVPPFELARGEVFERESLETAAIRLGNGYGPDITIQSPLHVPVLENAPRHAYLIENFDYLERSEFLVHHTEVKDQLDSHDYLSEVEKALIMSAANLMTYRIEHGRTR